MPDLKQLAQIYQGFKNLIFKSKEVEDIALPRLAICAECPNSTKDDSIPKCKICGCPLMSKTRSKNSRCPENRW